MAVEKGLNFNKFSKTIQMLSRDAYIDFYMRIAQIFAETVSF